MCACLRVYCSKLYLTQTHKARVVVKHLQALSIDRTLLSRILPSLLHLLSLFISFSTLFVATSVSAMKLECVGFFFCQPANTFTMIKLLYAPLAGRINSNEMRFFYWNIFFVSFFKQWKKFQHFLDWKKNLQVVSSAHFLFVFLLMLSHQSKFEIRNEFHNIDSSWTAAKWIHASHKCIGVRCLCLCAVHLIFHWQSARACVRVRERDDTKLKPRFQCQS